MKIATAIILLGAALSFGGCAVEPTDPNRQAAQEEEAAARVDDFVRNPPR